MKLKKILYTITFVFLIITISSFAKSRKVAKQSKENKTTIKETKSGDSETLNNSWYVMQAGSTPWGYYHEAIEKKKDIYVYRYEMTKIEKGVEYLENLGAIAKHDLTPVAFNLSKAGPNGTEITDGTFTKSETGGLFNITSTGTKNGNYKRNVAKDTILEAFFPIYLTLNASKFKTGQSSSVKILSENPESGEFGAKTAKFTIKGRDEKNQCTNIETELDDIRSKWCLTESGALIHMEINDHQIYVKKVSGEGEAKSFLKASNEKKKAE